MSMRWNGIFIGIGSYFTPDGETNGEKELVAPSFDARRVKKGFSLLNPEGKFVTLTDDLTGFPPIRNVIYSRLIRLLGEIEAGSPLVFYFAGHGFSEDGEFFLQPPDYLEEIPKISSISLNSILEIMSRHSGRKLIICDCCRVESDVADTTNLPVFASSPMVSVNEDMSIIWSCSKNQHSYESLVIGEEPAGLFSFFLNKAIYLNHLVRQPQAVSLYDIFEQAKIFTSEYVVQNLPRGNQTPIIFGGDVHNWIVFDDPAVVTQRSYLPDMPLEPFNTPIPHTTQDTDDDSASKPSEEQIRSIITEAVQVVDRLVIDRQVLARGGSTPPADGQAETKDIIEELLIQTFRLLCKIDKKRNGAGFTVRTGSEISKELGTGTISVAAISATLASNFQSVPLGVIITTVGIFFARVSLNTFCEMTSEYFQRRGIDPC
ncbi:MAG: caspase family protein [Magnetococcales bacterium]|nr:caspase family protein [Magnetococcales bacterium]